MDVVVAWPVLVSCAASIVGRSCIPLPTPLHTLPTPTSGAASRG